MLRNEIAEKDTWDLTTIYRDDAEWERAFADAERDMKTLAPMGETMLDSAEALYQTTKAVFDRNEQITRLYTYAHLKFSADTTSNTARKLMGKAQNLLTAYSEETAFYDTTLLQLAPETLDAYLAEHEGLRAYAGSVPLQAAHTECSGGAAACSLSEGTGNGIGILRIADFF